MKLKTALFIVGGGLGVYALYRYFSKQFALLQNWDYKIKYLTIKDFNNDSITLQGALSIINPSNFTLTINSYSLDFFYKGAFLAHMDDNKQVVVQPDTTFDAPILLSVKLSTLKTKGLLFAQDVVEQNPINFGIEGTANITFGGITQDVELKISDYEYSADLAQEYGYEKPLAATKEWICKNLYICI